MPTSPDPLALRAFPAEGFTLYLDAAGLEIRVDDFHPLPLKLSWDLLERMRREAQAPREAGQDDATGGGP